MRRPYVTARRLAELEAGLSARDRAILDQVARLRLMSGGQLATLHYGDTESARRLARRELVRLVDGRLLVRLGRRVGGVRAGSAGYLYGLDVAGQRLTRPERGRWWTATTPGESFVRHALTVSRLYVELHQGQESGGYSLRVFEAEVDCWRSFHGAGGQRLTLKPDAYVVTTSGGYEDHIFVEVDLATESTSRLSVKAARYLSYFDSGREQARSGVFPQVLWLVPDRRRRAQLVDVLGALPAQYWRLFAVALLDEAVAVITGGGDVELAHEVRP